MNTSYIINAPHLFDGRAFVRDRSITISQETISEISGHQKKADFEGWVTPAFIDAHSHIGMCREGEPSSEEESNDRLDQILPLNDAFNSIYFDDSAFSDCVDFGVLYACVAPGSGNLLGGQTSIIRTFAKNRSEALVAPHGIKLALGFNPRATTDWRGSRPNTRMGAYALLEKRFDQLLQKKEKLALQKERKLLQAARDKKEGKLTDGEYAREEALFRQEYELEFDAEEKVLLQLLNGERRAKVHVHKADDALYLIHLVKKYGIRASADHVLDVFDKEVFKALNDTGIPIVYGPLGSFKYKVELKHSSYKNVMPLLESGAFFGVMSDHPVTAAMNLKDQLNYFLMFGMQPEAALGLLTLRNAEILGIQDSLGTLEAGKAASLIVWNKNPLEYGSRPIAVFGEGCLLRG